MKFINEENLNFEFNTDPFPYVVIDNFINTDHLDPLLEDMKKLTKDNSYYYGDQEIEKNKYAFKENFQENLSNLFKELNGNEFITILENKTGIQDIIKNNLNLNGAGVHKVYNEGFLCMHTDFEAYNDNTHFLLDRRLNLLLYMNSEWKKEYHGELCLYDKKIGKITKKIEPLLNRCVIFITSGNIHGHPKPLEIPENICRQSITTYYYTKNTTGMNLSGNPLQQVRWYFDIKDND
jgi:Rps23 Pro-64 3,4-dihydroxylase Tpa1-like proline 4-hydroxylase